jgi:hypothetical protein
MKSQKYCDGITHRRVKTWWCFLFGSFLWCKNDPWFMMCCASHTCYMMCLLFPASDYWHFPAFVWCLHCLLWAPGDNKVHWGSSWLEPSNPSKTHVRPIWRVVNLGVTCRATCVEQLQYSLLGLMCHVFGGGGRTFPASDQIWLVILLQGEGLAPEDIGASSLSYSFWRSFMPMTLLQV